MTPKKTKLEIASFHSSMSIVTGPRPSTPLLGPVCVVAGTASAGTGSLVMHFATSSTSGSWHLLPLGIVPSAVSVTVSAG